MSKSLQEQVEIIRNVMNQKSIIPDYRFTYGKHVGKTLEWVMQNNPRYVAYLYANDCPLPKKVEEYVRIQIEGE